jgi:ABC-type phosphate transport system auxiliary subunit
MRQASYLETVARLSETWKSILELEVVFRRYDGLQQRTLQRLRQTSDQLDRYRIEYETIAARGTLTPEQHEKYRVVLTNLRRRYDLTVLLLKSNDKIAMKARVEEQVRKVMEITALLEKEENNLSFQMEDETHTPGF